MQKQTVPAVAKTVVMNGISSTQLCMLKFLNATLLLNKFTFKASCETVNTAIHQLNKNTTNKLTAVYETFSLPHTGSFG